MPWAAVACAVAGTLASWKPIVVHHPGWMRLDCKHCGARLRLGMTECEYCRTAEIWLVPPWDEHVYPSSSPEPARVPAAAPGLYRVSSEDRARPRQSDYSSSSPAPSPWAAPVFVASSYSAPEPTPAPTYEPPAPSPCPAPSFSSGGGGDFGGGGATGEY